MRDRYEDGWWVKDSIKPIDTRWKKKSLGHTRESLPKVCPVCDRAWHGNKHDWKPIQDFPKYGCVKKICEDCRLDQVMDYNSGNNPASM